MNEYDFTVKFNLGNSLADPDDFIDRLYEGGCDDALIGVGNKEYVALNFIREASSAYEAISTAINDVKRVVPGASLIEAAPDFVGLTDAAKILGYTQQHMTNLTLENDSKFPIPVYEGAHSVWHLAEILIWLRENQTHSIDDTLLDIAQTNMNINIARGWQKIPPDTQESIKALAV
ncbi:helix-turn-helix transcriptional regulator [Microcoleus sp.]|uniref:helix-turn-helix transcriptional regulator n=1 Tax=Microcoleus sp. TaxID=44472 RepID=UPI0035269D8B